jgi:Family of unknown function (DUF6335)
MARKQAGRGKRTRGGARQQGRGSRPAAGAKRRAARKQAGSRKRSTARAARPAKKTVKAARKAAPPKARPVTRKTAAATAPAPRRQAPSLERSRRRLTEVEDNIPTPPSSLDMDRTPTAARSGREASKAARSQHTETGPELTGGDVDADWEDAYSVGDEAPGGDNPTPDQDRVDDIGRALGVEYQDNEELKGGDKIAGRDKHRWELDPASAEDYNDRDED